MSTSRTENDKDIVIFLPPVDPNKPDRPVDPVTGEINWDCPCMQGYVHGPCGEAFRTAYSCYIEASSEAGVMDQCAEKFVSMQGCFEKFPEFYADDKTEDDDNEGGNGDGNNSIDTPSDQSSTSEGHSADENTQSQSSMLSESSS
ncbi:Oxidoreductase [Dispira parvispora]|uniref:Mitochondrial intermembrane space import and assembly protein 40 n=1 Tax=Dispira parvispora TaxID=1520584 RepID=A0A9W8AVH8_9FUNG|nr:Oxidoreductase [Dispira parvispora]